MSCPPQIFARCNEKRASKFDTWKLSAFAALRCKIPSLAGVRHRSCLPGAPSLPVIVHRYLTQLYQVVSTYFPHIKRLEDWWEPAATLRDDIHCCCRRWRVGRREFFITPRGWKFYVTATTVRHWFLNTHKHTKHEGWFVASYNNADSLQDRSGLNSLFVCTMIAKCYRSSFEKDLTVNRY